MQGPPVGNLFFGLVRESGPGVGGATDTFYEQCFLQVPQVHAHIPHEKKTYSLGELSGWRVLSFLTRGEKARHNRCVDFDIGPVSQE